MPTFLRTTATPNVVETVDAAANATTAYTMQVGQTFGGTRSGSGDNDWIAIELVAGRTYTFAMVATAGEIGSTVSQRFDTFLTLYNASNTSVGTNDDGGPGLNSSLTYTAATSGTYYIQAGAFNASGSGNYEVSVVEGTRSTHDINMIAAELIRSGYSWAATYGTGAVVTYGFRETGATYAVDGHNVSTFTQITESERATIRSILQLWSDVCGITFQEVNPTGFTDNATILFGNYSDSTDGSGAFAYFPGSVASASAAGDVWLNVANGINSTTSPVGSYSWFAIAHELGHALGLAHPGDYNAAPGVSITYNSNAQFTQDSQLYTMMSYFAESNTNGASFNGQYAATPMMADIYAAQQLYGSRTTTRAGDTVYGYTSTAGAAFDLAVAAAHGFCIWDGGGTDYLVGSGYSGTQSIDLQAGSFSDMAGGVANVSIALNCIIEGAVGGTGTDYIYGNSANNIIDGNLGNDSIIGGAGSDTLYGGGGLDTLNYSTSTSGININLGAGACYDDGLVISGNIHGYDTINGFEQVIGTNFGDIFRGSENVDYLNGGGGDDYIAYAGAGNDAIDGGTGFNTMSYYDVGTGIFLNLAANTSTDGQGGTDYLYNIQQVYGSNWASDSMTGDANYNVLRGFGGNDFLAGGRGSDTLYGGTGSDQFIWSSNDIVVGQWDTVQDFDRGGNGDFDYLRFLDVSVSMYETGGHTYIAPTYMVGSNGANVLNGGGVIVMNTSIAQLAGHFLFG